jgi:hypothetical protein
MEDSAYRSFDSAIKAIAPAPMLKEETILKLNTVLISWTKKSTDAQNLADTSHHAVGLLRSDETDKPRERCFLLTNSRVDFDDPMFGSMYMTSAARHDGIGLPGTVEPLGFARPGVCLPVCKVSDWSEWKPEHVKQEGRLRIPWLGADHFSVDVKDFTNSRMAGFNELWQQGLDDARTQIVAHVTVRSDNIITAGNAPQVSMGTPIAVRKCIVWAIVLGEVETPQTVRAASSSHVGLVSLWTGANRKYFDICPLTTEILEEIEAFKTPDRGISQFDGR